MTTVFPTSRRVPPERFETAPILSGNRVELSSDGETVLSNPDMKRLCDAARQHIPMYGRPAEDAAEAIVRAVLMELREPSEAMIEEGNSVRTSLMASENTRATWDVMIAAALTPTKREQPR